MSTTTASSHETVKELNVFHKVGTSSCVSGQEVVVLPPGHVVTNIEWRQKTNRSRSHQVKHSVEYVDNCAHVTLKGEVRNTFMKAARIVYDAVITHEPRTKVDGGVSAPALPPPPPKYKNNNAAREVFASLGQTVVSVVTGVGAEAERERAEKERLEAEKRAREEAHAAEMHRLSVQATEAGAAREEAREAARVARTQVEQSQEAYVLAQEAEEGSRAKLEDLLQQLALAEEEVRQATTKREAAEQEATAATNEAAAADTRLAETSAVVETLTAQLEAVAERGPHGKVDEAPGAAGVGGASGAEDPATTPSEQDPAEP